MNTISDLVNTGEATIIDVRTPGEYREGHISRSINIPLREIPQHLDELRNMKNIVLCCASGVRSQQAASLLRENGISCNNGGSWHQVNSYC